MAKRKREREREREREEIGKKNKWIGTLADKYFAPLLMHQWTMWYNSATDICWIKKNCEAVKNIFKYMSRYSLSQR